MSTKSWAIGIARIVATILIIAALTLPYSYQRLLAQEDTPPPNDTSEDITLYATEEETFDPDAEEELVEPERVEVSEEEGEAMLEAYLKLRSETSAPYNLDTSLPAQAVPLASLPDAASAVGDDTAIQFHGAPSDFITPSNVLNTRANLANGLTSSLAEPAAANEGPYIFYAGNLRHAEYSTNGGLTWVNVPVPAGPADAPTACCDNDVVYDQARGVTFWSTLYLNAARTNGVVRIFVRRNISQANNCSYTIDPAGTANNTVPDYPHINVSNDFLYLTTNNVGGGAASGRAQVRRFNIDQMADCATTGFNTFSYVWSSGVGQRVLVPVEGARETMYWALHEDLDTLRVFAWNEANASPTSVLRNIAASTFGPDEDCSGGEGGNDWWDDLAASIIGFTHRGAVGHGRIHFYWNVASDNAHAQGYIRGAIFDERTSGAGHVVGNLLAQPVIFNNDYCFGFPIVSANERGDIGLVLAFGGNAGVGGAAAQPAIGIDDDFTSGLGVFGAAGGFNFNPIAAGTHNRADARYGDYFTIHPHEPCDLFFNATGYALNGGTAATNVNARYVEFGRQRDSVCYFGWDDETR